MKAEGQIPYCLCHVSFFFFNDTATTEIYPLSLHDALPICLRRSSDGTSKHQGGSTSTSTVPRSEEHTSELQSRFGISYAVFCFKKTRDPTHPVPAPRSGIAWGTRRARAPA